MKVFEISLASKHEQGKRLKVKEQHKPTVMKFMNIPFLCVAFKRWAVKCYKWINLACVTCVILKWSFFVHRPKVLKHKGLKTVWSTRSLLRLKPFTMHLSRVVIAISCVFLQIIPEVSCGKFSWQLFCFV